MPPDEISEAGARFLDDRPAGAVPAAGRRSRMLPKPLMRGLSTGLIITALIAGIGTLIVLAISYVVPCAVTSGSLDALPMSTLNCTRGQLSFGRVYMLADIPDVELDVHYHFGHAWLGDFGWVSMAAPRAYLDDHGVSLRHDGCMGPDIPHLMFPGEFTRPTSPLTLENARFLRLDAPMWLFSAVLLPIPIVAFIRGPYRQHRRRNQGLCLHCGYNLTGNVTGICPECGKRTHAA